MSDQVIIDTINGLTLEELQDIPSEQIPDDQATNEPDLTAAAVVWIVNRLRNGRSAGYIKKLAKIQYGKSPSTRQVKLIEELRQARIEDLTPAAVAKVIAALSPSTSKLKAQIEKEDKALWEKREKREKTKQMKKKK